MDTMAWLLLVRYDPMDTGNGRQWRDRM